MRRFLSFVFIVPITFYALSGYAQTLTPELRVALQETLDNSHTEVHGVSVAVNFPDGSVWTGVRGYSHSDVKIDTSTLFITASVTKHFIGPLILKLCQEGLIELNDSIYHWIPPYNNLDSTITLEQLLTHTSGLPHHIAKDNDVAQNTDKIWEPAEKLERLGPPLFQPGDSVSYSNVGFNILTMIIDSVTHQPVTEVLREQIFDPFSLESSYFWPYEDYSGTVAHPWWSGDGYGSFNHLNMSWVKGAGNLLSTPYDLALWSKSLMQGQFLNEEYTAELFQPKTEVGTGKLGQECFSYGTIILKDIKIRTREPIDFFGHTGYYLATYTGLFYLPDDSISIAVCANDDEKGPFVFEIMFELIETLHTGQSIHEILAERNQRFDIQSDFTEGQLIDTIRINTDYYNYESVKFRMVSTGIAKETLSLDTEQGIIRVKDPDVLSTKNYINMLIQVYPVDSVPYLVEEAAIRINIQKVNVNQNLSGQFKIYPNPTNSFLTIETDQPDCYSIDIHSLNGQLIYKEEMEGISKQIDMTPFSKGIYFITVRSDAWVRTEKVVRY